MRKKGLLLLTFVTFQTPLTLLTNCAMVQWTNGPMDRWSNQPMIQWSNGPMVRTLTQCSIAISRLDGIGMGYIVSTGIGFFLFKWTFDCSLFWV